MSLVGENGKRKWVRVFASPRLPGLAVLLVVLALGAVAAVGGTTSQADHAVMAAEQAPPGCNGDIKVHDGNGEPTPIEKDEPKVCSFHLHGFNFDPGSRVTWRIETQPGGVQVLNGSLTVNAQGEARTGLLTLPNGQYKVFWHQEGCPGGDKQKVFKVECPLPTSTPTATATTVPGVPTNTPTPTATTAPGVPTSTPTATTAPGVPTSTPTATTVPGVPTSTPTATATTAPGAPTSTPTATPTGAPPGPSAATATPTPAPAAAPAVAGATATPVVLAAVATPTAPAALPTAVAGVQVVAPAAALPRAGGLPALPLFAIGGGMSALGLALRRLRR